MMSERKKTYLRLLVEIFSAVLCTALIVVFGGPVLDIMMPFLLAFTMAWAFNPVIQFMQRHLRLTRKLFSFLLVLLFYIVLAFFALWAAGLFVSQVVDMARAVPGIIAALQSAYNQLVLFLESALSSLPPEYASLRQEFFTVLSEAWSWLRGLISSGISSAVGFTSSFALAVPERIIFATVLILASCIITADFPNLRENIYTYLGSRGKHSLRLMGHSFRTAVLGFFRSQLIFALADMCIILVAFFIIGVPYPLPIALVLCILDFIPFFGAGTVLVPWGAVCAVLGDVSTGIQLLLLYAILYIIRRIFEPHVLGGATGFSSLQMLFSMYAGMKLYGVTGLILAPIIWITAVNFLHTGILNGFIDDFRFVIADIGRSLARPVPTTTTEPPSPSAHPSGKPHPLRRFFSAGVSGKSSGKRT